MVLRFAASLCVLSLVALLVSAVPVHAVSGGPADPSALTDGPSLQDPLPVPDPPTAALPANVTSETDGDPVPLEHNLTNDSLDSGSSGPSVEHPQGAAPEPPLLRTVTRSIGIVDAGGILAGPEGDEVEGVRFAPANATEGIFPPSDSVEQSLPEKESVPDAALPSLQPETDPDPSVAGKREHADQRADQHVNPLPPDQTSVDPPSAAQDIESIDEADASSFLPDVSTALFFGLLVLGPSLAWRAFHRLPAGTRFWHFLGAFLVRVKSHKVFDKSERRQLYQIIQDNPGISTHELCKLSGMTRDAIDHHIQVISRANLLESEMVGKEKCHFVASAPAERTQRRACVFLRHDAYRRVVRFIRDHPGAVQKRVADVEGLTSKYQTYQVLRNLRSVGIVSAERKGNITHYSLGPLGERVDSTAWVLRGQ